jgi:hypothetical protein
MGLMGEMEEFLAAAAAAAAGPVTDSQQAAAGRADAANVGYGYGRWVVTRYAMIEEKSGIVYNVIELEMSSNYELVNGYRYIQSNTASTGDHFNGQAFTRPPTPETPEEGTAPDTGRKIEDVLQEALIRIELLEQNQDAVLGDLANLSGRVADAETGK